MYSLKEGWQITYGADPVIGWDGLLYCNVTDAAITYYANKTQGFLKAYTFTLVLRGSLKLMYNGREITLFADDLYIYAPGLPVTILSASEDYRGICLLADDEFTPVEDLVRIAYYPIVQLKEPKLTLSHDDATVLRVRLEEIPRYLHSSVQKKTDIVRHLYSVFLLELQSALEGVEVEHRVPKRMETVFVEFIRLLPQHYVSHHRIGYYAEKLHISTTYLSRVVKRISGHTVMDFINQHLLTEATFYLRTTSLSIGEIADQLHFADYASFCKFFSRLAGQPPSAFRKRLRG